MSFLAYKLSYVYMYIRIPIYVCKEKLTAGSEEVKMDKNEGRRRETLSPSRGRRDGFSVSKRTPWKLPSIMVRRSGHLGPILSHKGPRKSSVDRIDISNEGSIQGLGNGPGTNFGRDITRFFTLRAPPCRVILLLN